MTPLLVGVGAFVGAPLRHLVSSWLDHARWPWGTLVVNLAGSAALGLLSGVAVGGDATALLGAGFCGGFTTYSAFAVQTHRLGGRRGTTYAVVTVAGSVAACAAAFVVGAQV